MHYGGSFCREFAYVLAVLREVLRYGTSLGHNATDQYWAVTNCNQGACAMYTILAGILSVAIHQHLGDAGHQGAAKIAESQKSGG